MLAALDRPRLEQRLLPFQVDRAIHLIPTAADELRHVFVGPILREAECGADCVVRFGLDRDPFPASSFRKPSAERGTAPVFCADSERGDSPRRFSGRALRQPRLWCSTLRKCPGISNRTPRKIGITPFFPRRAGAYAADP
jgi:hypothetical protein